MFVSKLPISESLKFLQIRVALESSSLKGWKLHQHAQSRVILTQKEGHFRTHGSHYGLHPFRTMALRREYAFYSQPSPRGQIATQANYIPYSHGVIMKAMGHRLMQK